MDEDDEFEVTAEMLIHEDVDDEGTLAEAEAQESVGEVEEEVADLQQESELPLEELLKRYGYSLAGESSGELRSEEEGGGGGNFDGEGEEEEVRGGGRKGGCEEGRDRGVKRGRIRDSVAAEEDASTSSYVKKLNIEQETLTGEEEVSLQSSAHKEINQTENERDSVKLESTDESVNELSTGTPPADSSNHEYFPPTSNSITSVPAVPPSLQDHHHHLSEALPDPLQLGTNPSLQPPPPLKPHLPHHHTLTGILTPAVSVAPLDTAIEHTALGAMVEGSSIEHTALGAMAEGSSIEHTPLGAMAEGSSIEHTALGAMVEGSSIERTALGAMAEVSVIQHTPLGGIAIDHTPIAKSSVIEHVSIAEEGSVLSDGEAGGSVGHGGSVFLAEGGHLMLGHSLLPARRVGGGVGRRGGGEGSEVGAGGREGSRLPSGGGEREFEQSPRLADGYSSDPQSSSDAQSHTPSSSSSTSLQTSSFSSSSSVSGGSTRTAGGPPHSSDIRSRLRPELPERRSMRLMANDEKMLDSYFSAFFDDDEGDDEYFPVEEWKQEIRVGPSYQVHVGDRPSQEPYPQQRDNTSDASRLLWRPRSPEDRVVSYLKAVSTVVKPNSGINSWETEQAMKVLQECDHNVQRAVDVVQEQGLPAGTRPWGEEECKEFEEGLRVSGKDFFQLKKLVPSRSVKELVEFYYVWKKSKRYEDFIIQHGKMGKKKVTLQPGQVFDFMDNYLNMQDSTAPDLHYATTTVYAEHKRETV